MGDEDLEDILDPESDPRRNRIAYPSPAPTPALRGVTSNATQPQTPTSTAPPPDLGIAKPQIPSLAPLTQQTTRDRETQQRLDQGSGISQIANPWARGALRGLNIAGTVASSLVPGVGAALHAIPGTEEHHNSLVRQNTAALNADEAQAHTEAETGQADAAAGKDAAEAVKDQALATAAANKPGKEEKWDSFAGFTDTDGVPLVREENSGQVVRANDHKPPAGFKASTPTKEVDPKRDIQTQLAAEMAKPAPDQATVKALQQRLRDIDPLGEDRMAAAEGRANEADVDRHQQRDFEQRRQTEADADKKQNAREKELAPTQAALDYADTYAQSVHTGSGDEALMEKFFELAKPSSGFRMSQPQIDMLRTARSWMEGTKALAYHALTGTWFSDEQRNQIMATMKALGEAKVKGTGEVRQQGAAATGQAVSFKEGNDVYNIPPNKVQAFKLKHPNALQQ